MPEVFVPLRRPRTVQNVFFVGVQAKPSEPMRTRGCSRQAVAYR